MTKQEKIQEAYGKYWKIVQNNIDNNGWVSYASFPEYFLRKKELLDFKGETQSTCLVRPKKLKNIETNNGWIKIEREEDLPDLNNENITFLFGSVLSTFPSENVWMDVNFFMRYSHYRVNEKVLMPIF